MERNGGESKEKTLVAFLIGFHVKSILIYFAILSIIGQIAMYLIYYAHSHRTKWLSLE